MSSKQGSVEKLYVKNVKTRRGNSKTYSLLIDGEWYNCGFDSPGVEDGDFVKFDYTDDDYGHKVDVDSIKRKKGTSTTQGSSAKAASGKKDAGGKVQENWDARAKYWENKEAKDEDTQKRIMYQSATNVAVNIAVAALENEILPLGAKNAKKEVKMDLFTAYVDQLADEFFLKFEGLPARDFEHGADDAVADDDEPIPVDDVADDDDDDWED